MISVFQNKIYILSKRYGDKLGLDLPYFVKNIFWTFLRQSVGVISGLLLSVVFARLATKDIFGQYQLILSIFSIVSVLSIPGLNVSVARSVAKGNEGDYKKSVRTSFIWSLLGIPILLFAGVYYYVYDIKVIGIALMVSSIFFPLFYATNTWERLFIGKSRFDIHARYVSVQSIVGTAVIVIVIFFNKNNLLPIVISYFIINTFFSVFYYFKSLKYVSNAKTSEDVVKYGFFLTLTNSADLIAENIDRIIIASLLSPAVLAIFSVISLFPVKFRSIVKPFLIIAFPKMTSEKITLKNIIKEKKKIFYVLFCVLILGGIAYYFIIEELNQLFFGQNYADYYHYSKYFVLFVIFALPLFFLTKYAQAKKMNKVIFITNPVFLVFRVILMFFSVYIWGLPGAILAFNVSIALKFALFLFLVKFD